MRSFRCCTLSGAGAGDAPGEGAGDCAACAGGGLPLAVDCDVGCGELCATAGLFALATFAFWGGLTGGNRTFHKIRTAAEATRATMNLCCCCIRAFFWSALTCQRFKKRRQVAALHNYFTG